MALFSPKTIRLFCRNFLLTSGSLFILILTCCGSNPPAGNIHVADEPVSTEAVNINTATAEDLKRLPGIGAKRAEKIIEHRITFGPFRSPAQLMLVEGIGEKQFLKMRPLIRTD